MTKCRNFKCNGTTKQLIQCKLCSSVQYCRHHLSRISHVEKDLEYVYTISNLIINKFNISQNNVNNFRENWGHFKWVKSYVHRKGRGSYPTTIFLCFSQLVLYSSSLRCRAIHIELVRLI